MNLQEFLNYRTYCPCCNKTLITNLFLAGRRILSQKNSELRCLVQLNGLHHKEPAYKALYVFDVYDNSVKVDFLKKDQVFCESVCPLFLIEKFKKYNQNAGWCWFIRSCCSYEYSSTAFWFPFKTGLLPDLKLQQERIGFVYQSMPSRLLIKLNLENFHYENPPTSKLYLNEKVIELNSTVIPITTKDQLMERIENLLPFL